MGAFIAYQVSEKALNAQLAYLLSKTGQAPRLKTLGGGFMSLSIDTIKIFSHEDQSALISFQLSIIDPTHPTDEPMRAQLRYDINQSSYDIDPSSLPQFPSAFSLDKSVLQLKAGGSYQTFRMFAEAVTGANSLASATFEESLCRLFGELVDAAEIDPSGILGSPTLTSRLESAKTFRNLCETSLENNSLPFEIIEHTTNPTTNVVSNIPNALLTKAWLATKAAGNLLPTPAIYGVVSPDAAQVANLNAAQAANATPLPTQFDFAIPLCEINSSMAARLIDPGQLRPIFSLAATVSANAKNGDLLLLKDEPKALADSIWEWFKENNSVPAPLKAITGNSVVKVGATVDPSGGAAGGWKMSNFGAELVEAVMDAYNAGSLAAPNVAELKFLPPGEDGCFVIALEVLEAALRTQLTLTTIEVVSTVHLMITSIVPSIVTSLYFPSAVHRLRLSVGIEIYTSELWWDPTQVWGAGEMVIEVWPSNEDSSPTALSMGPITLKADGLDVVVREDGIYGTLYGVGGKIGDAKKAGVVRKQVLGEIDKGFQQLVKQLQSQFLVFTDVGANQATAGKGDDYWAGTKVKKWFLGGGGEESTDLPPHMGFLLTTHPPLAPATPLIDLQRPTFSATAAQVPSATVAAIALDNFSFRSVAILGDPVISAQIFQHPPAGGDFLFWFGAPILPSGQPSQKASFNYYAKSRASFIGGTGVGLELSPQDFSWPDVWAVSEPMSAQQFAVSTQSLDGLQVAKASGATVAQIDSMLQELAQLSEAGVEIVAEIIIDPGAWLSDIKTALGFGAVPSPSSLVQVLDKAIALAPAPLTIEVSRRVISLDVRDSAVLVLAFPDLWLANELDSKLPHPKDGLFGPLTEPEYGRLLKVLGRGAENSNLRVFRLTSPNALKAFAGDT